MISPLRRPFLGLCALALFAALASPASAGFTTFTSRAAFDAAIPPTAGVDPNTINQTINFESNTAPTTIPNNTALDGITFSYSLSGGQSLQVVDLFDTTSAF